MKKQNNFWLVMFLAISLVLPVYSMAQTAPTKLTLEDSTGNRISTPGIKSFAIGTDNNLVIYLDQPFNFTDLFPNISIDDTPGSYTPSSLVVTKPASITATQPPAGTSLPLTFKVTSTTPSAMVSLVVDPEGRTLPASSSSPFTFPSWDIGGATPAAVGSYLAVFQAQVGTQTPSQLVVMINVVAATPVDPVAQFVTNFYVKILGQSPSTTELNTWVTNLKNKTQTANDIATQFFITSTQGQGLSNNDFIRLLYEVLLQRTPGQGEIDYWASQIASMTRTGLLDFFIRSQEFSTKCNTLGILAYRSTVVSYTVSTYVSPQGAGSVTGAGSYASGATVTVQANPVNSCYTFDYWTEGTSTINVSSSNPYSFTITQDRNLVANFKSTGATGCGVVTGMTWPWGQGTQVWANVNKGEIITYSVTVPPPSSVFAGSGVKMIIISVYGGNGDTVGSMTWQYPNNGSLFVSQSKTLGNGTAALLRLYPLAGSQYLPEGQHTLTINCEANNSYFMIQMDVY